MLQRAGILIVAGLLGAGSAVGVTACGEERGSVKFEGDTGGTTTAGTETEATGTTGATGATGTTGTTSPTSTEP
jgi:collagen type VII alpha